LKEKSIATKCIIRRTIAQEMLNVSLNKNSITDKCIMNCNKPVTKNVSSRTSPPNNVNVSIVLMNPNPGEKNAS